MNSASAFVLTVRTIHFRDYREQFFKPYTFPVREAKQIIEFLSQYLVGLSVLLAALIVPIVSMLLLTALCAALDALGLPLLWLSFVQSMGFLVVPPLSLVVYAYAFVPVEGYVRPLVTILLGLFSLACLLSWDYFRTQQKYSLFESLVDYRALVSIWFLVGLAGVGAGEYIVRRRRSGILKRS